MTVEPGFGGQSFMKDVMAEKVLAARELLSHRAVGGEVHVDGGINRETAEFVGRPAVDMLVVGSALWIKGHDMGREIRLVRALADEGYQYGSTRASRRSRGTGGSASPACPSTSPASSWTRSRRAGSR